MSKKIIITTVVTSIPDNEILKILDKREKYFSNVPGLIRKFWCRGKSKNTYYGIIEFEDEESLDEYLKTDFVSSISQVYKTKKPVKISIMDAFKEENYFKS